MEKTNIIHFKGLNGLRAIAALSVVIHHLIFGIRAFNLDSNTTNMGKYSANLPFFSLMGSASVTIFFTLSGFLITYLLLKEKAVSEVHVGKFYVRRILRIWPLYYLYLILFTAVALLLLWKKNCLYLPFYFFIAGNIPFMLSQWNPILYPWPKTEITHYWSLGVEEQFYLMWPWFIKKTPVHKLSLFISLFFIAFVSAKIIFRFGLKFSGNQLPLPYAILYTNQFDCMLIGGLASVLYYNKNELFLKLFNSRIAQLIGWVFLLFLATNHHIATFIDNEVISVGAVILIIGQITVRNRLINLENRVFDFLGKISYGIYVIHPMVIFTLSKILAPLTINNGLKYILVFLSVISATILLAYLSYTFFEKRFLRLKTKYSIVHSLVSKQE